MPLCQLTRIRAVQGIALLAALTTLILFAFPTARQAATTVAKGFALIPPFTDISGVYGCYGYEEGGVGGPSASSGPLTIYPYGVINERGLMVSNWNSTTEITVVGSPGIASIRLDDRPGRLTAYTRPEAHVTHSGGGYIFCDLPWQ
jgi:hypothetical protein